MSVVTSIEDNGPCSKKLTIEVPGEAVEAEMGRVVGKFRKSLRLPGFRAGKVPESMVHSRFRDEIRQEVVDRLLPRYWHQAQAEKGLDPMLPPEVEELDLELGKPMTVVAVVATRPEVELKDYRNFDLPAEDIDPTADEVDDALADLQRGHAEWREIERPAARGDMVEANVVPKARERNTTVPKAQGEASGDGAPADSKPIQVELGADGVSDELTITLTGLSAGGSTDFRPEGSDGTQDQQIEVIAVKEQDLPELDDDFASRLGLASMDELRQAAEDNLRQAKKRDIDQRRQQSLLEQLRERHPLELPGRVVDKERDTMLQDYAGQLQSHGVDIETAEIDWAARADEIRPEAERRVHNDLLLDAIAQAESLRLDESEFERFLSAAAAQQQQSSLALRQQLSESGGLEPLRARMLRAQTARFLLGDDGADDSAPDGDASDGDASGDSVPDGDQP